MNKGRSDPSNARSTLVELLRWRAADQPTRRIYTFLLDGETQEACLTYGELDRQARAIGALLQSQGATGQRALLLYPPGLEYIVTFFGCLYAGVVAVPVYPPNLMRLDRALPRLHGIASDACPLVALTTSPILSLVEPVLAQVSDFQAMRWLTTDNVGPELAETWREPAVSSDTLAFLQYTSGSTTAPKGVMVSHGNLLHNNALIHQALEVTESSVGVSWLPLYHDMGLIGTVLQILYSDVQCVLMSSMDFLQKPFRWLQAISRYRGTASGGPNFAYDLCVRKITPEQRATLDLSSWSIAFNGAEPIRSETLERFAATFAPCGFRREAFFPCYGLAEATLFVSGGPGDALPVTARVHRADLEHNRVALAPAEETSVRTLVGCGQTWPAQKIAIVDPETRTQCRPDQVGEIWIAGPSVAQGYWNQSEATEHTFRAYLSDTQDGPFLRTGDLGFVRDGELFITSRLKDLIIIRGRNHAPQDIEATVEKSHPALRPDFGVAFSVDVAGEERLVIVHEIARQCREVDVEQVAGAIRQAVAENHDLQVYAVVLIETGSMPKTSSGKLQRHACRAAFLSDDLQQVGSNVLEALDDETGPPTDGDRLTRAALWLAEPTQRQEMLAAYLFQQLREALGVSVSRLALEEPFTAFGLDSLKALELKNRIQTDLGVDVPLVRFIEWPTVAQFTAGLLDELAATVWTLEEPALAEELLSRLDQLSDEEVDSWLQQMVAEGV